MIKRFSILGTEILPGTEVQLSLNVAKLHTNTPIQVPVIISRAKKEGPILLLLAGMHGDEINGMEIIRRVIRKKWNRPNTGTVICIPVFNIFGYLNVKRELPDGRDLNRCFPGTKNGSLASQFAFQFMKEIAPHVDVVLDFHTGSAQRSNISQIRCVMSDEISMELAQVFNAPFIVHSNYIPKSIRESMNRMGKRILLFEGGKTNSINETIVQEGLDGIQRILNFFGMRAFKTENIERKPILIKSSRWIRAPHSGVFKPYVENGQQVTKGEIIGAVCDPFGGKELSVRSNSNGFLICISEAPLVNRGDAIFNIGSTTKKTKSTTTDANS